MVVNKAKKGEKEAYTITPDSGEYFIEVRGKENKPQFYSLEIDLENK